MLFFVLTFDLHLLFVDRYTVSPSITRAEMYRLGHTFERKSPSVVNLIRVSPIPSHIPPVINVPSTFVRALILGSKNSGKGRLVQKLHRLAYSPENANETTYPLSTCSVSKIIRPKPGGTTTMRKGEETVVVHLILTEVSTVDMSSDTEKRDVREKLAILLGQEKSGKRPYDMALLVFDATDMQSLEVAKELESTLLTVDMPRVFVGTASKPSSGECQPIIHKAMVHCECMDLESPLVVSLEQEEKLDPSVLEHLVSCAQDERQVVVPFRSTPHGGKKRRDAARRRKILWIGGLVIATVGLGLTLKKRIESSENGGGWLKFIQKMLPF